jgi:hypothetical protein
MSVLKRALASGGALVLFAALAMAAYAAPAHAQSTPAKPVGHLDGVAVSGSKAEVRGWAADPSSPDRDVKVDVYVDGDYAETTTTDVSRPDVAAAFPSYGSTTGFEATVGLTGGSHEVCVFAIDQETLNTQLGCQTVTATASTMPVGYLDAVSVSGQKVQVRGWAADPSSPQRDVLVDVYIDGDYADTTTTEGSRPDVAAAFPSYGDSTGFDVTTGVSAGSHRVCAFAIDEDSLNTRLGCQTVDVSAPMMPVGFLDQVTVSGQRVEVRGWAADPSSPQRDVTVDIYVDGDYAETTSTDVARPDVATAFPSYGDTTGYDTSFGVDAGSHRVCAFAIDQDTLNTRLGCETVSAGEPMMPVGTLDAATVSLDGDLVVVSGWAADPSSPQRDVTVDVYVDGDYAATTTTDVSRPDVAAAFPSYGDSTGYVHALDVAAGTHRVCAFAIDQDTLNTRLGCESVTLTS